MNILIAGASGFIGHQLIRSLKKNHLITVLGRNKYLLLKEFGNYVNCVDWEDLSFLDARNYDVIINLCGYNIAARRWRSSVKKELIESRVNSNQKLLEWIITQQATPRFFCANAVGIYGLQQNGDTHAFTEEYSIDLAHPTDFMSEIGIRWQESLNPGIEYGLSITTLRFGVVLKKGQGMLKKLQSSFSCGLGSILGDGEQILSWIHNDDLINAIVFLLNHPEKTGAFNLTAPYPISQKKFASTFARILHRPLLLKMPNWLVRGLFGEMGDCVLLRGQRVVPKRLMDAGFTFLYPTLEQALVHEFQKRIPNNKDSMTLNNY